MSISANYPTVATSLNLDFANSQQLDPRISFSRPTTAAYYDANTTALAEQNLLLQSQNFPMNWSNSFVTTNATATTAPDGTTTGNSLTSTSSSSTFTGVYQTCTNVPQTYSVYAKAGTSNFVSLINTNFGNSWATFNLSTGLVSSSALCTPSMVSVGNGWYRCIMANATGTNINFIIAGKDADPGATPWNNGTMASGNYIYIWGAQLEQRSAVTAYTPTTTTAITNYIPVLLTAPTNQARFDHDPVARTSLGLLIEQQSTNLVTYSSDYTNGIWTKSNATITANADIAPDGTQTAQLFASDTTYTQHFVRQVISSLTGTYTFTVYAKAAGINYLILRENASIGYRVSFNLSNGTVGQTSTGLATPTITSVGNGWYRCSITEAVSSQSFGCALYLSQTDNFDSPAYTGNGYSGVYLWGAQLEALAFPTSYIPTTVSQVTRSADSASMTGTNFSSWYNISQGTIYVSGRINYLAPTNVPVLQVGQSTSNLTLYINAGQVLEWGQLNTYDITSTVNIGTSTFKALVTGVVNSNVVSGNLKIGVNGSTATSGTGGYSWPPLAQRIALGFTDYNSNGLNGWISKLAYYPVALSATNLQSLTGS